MNEFSNSSAAVAAAQVTPRLTATLTGTGPGPAAFNGLAGAGTLVCYGDKGGVVKLQFDAGRGTTMRLSQLAWNPPSSMQSSSRTCTTITRKALRTLSSFGGFTMVPGQKSTASALPTSFHREALQ